MRTYIDNRRSEVTGDWPALTTALSPRIERPELCARLAPLNQPTAPSPRPSPPPRGRGCPKGGRGGGSWAGRIVRHFMQSRPLGKGWAALEQREAGNTCSLSLRSEEHTSELQSLTNLVCRLLLEK